MLLGGVCRGCESHCRCMHVLAGAAGWLVYLRIESPIMTGWRLPPDV